MSPQIVVVLRVGAEGGDITLAGRESASGSWQFARVTVDQTEALFGEGDEVVPAESAWVDGWEAGLCLMDRYPWAMLYPLTVHPDFVDRIEVAVEKRLASEEPSPHVKWAKRKWETAARAAQAG